MMDDLDVDIAPRDVQSRCTNSTNDHAYSSRGESRLGMSSRGYGGESQRGESRLGMFTSDTGGGGGSSSSSSCSSPGPSAAGHAADSINFGGRQSRRAHGRPAGGGAGTLSLKNDSIPESPSSFYPASDPEDDVAGSGSSLGSGYASGRAYGAGAQDNGLSGGSSASEGGTVAESGEAAAAGLPARSLIVSSESEALSEVNASHLRGTSALLYTAHNHSGATMHAPHTGQPYPKDREAVGVPPGQHKANRPVTSFQCGDTASIPLAWLVDHNRRVPVSISGDGLGVSGNSCWRPVVANEHVHRGTHQWRLTCSCAAGWSSGEGGGHGSGTLDRIRVGVVQDGFDPNCKFGEPGCDGASPTWAFPLIPQTVRTTTTSKDSSSVQVVVTLDCESGTLDIEADGETVGQRVHGLQGLHLSLAVATMSLRASCVLTKPDSDAGEHWEKWRPAPEGSLGVHVDETDIVAHFGRRQVMMSYQRGHSTFHSAVDATHPQMKHVLDPSLATQGFFTEFGGDMQTHAPFTPARHSHDGARKLFRVLDGNSAATLIQAKQRQIAAKRAVADKRDSLERAAAATKIQGATRSRKAKKEDAAATKIQATQRGKNVRKQKQDKEEGDAATKIQAAHRGKNVRKGKKAGGKAKEQEDAAATKIQGAASKKRRRKVAQDKLKQSFLDQADKIFDAIDADGSGTVDHSELISGLKGNKSLMRMIRRADPEMKLEMQEHLRRSSSSSSSSESSVITRESFHAFVSRLCEDIHKAQEAAKRRKDGILSQAEKMFQALDKDGSDDVDAAELAEGMNSSQSFSRLMRQLGRPITLSDITAAPSIGCKKFKEFISRTIDKIEKEKEELDFGGLFEEDDAATKIQAAHRGKAARAKA